MLLCSLLFVLPFLLLFHVQFVSWHYSYDLRMDTLTTFSRLTKINRCSPFKLRASLSGLYVHTSETGQSASEQCGFHFIWTPYTKQLLVSMYKNKKNIKANSSVHIINGRLVPDLWINVHFSNFFFSVFQTDLPLCELTTVSMVGKINQCFWVGLVMRM